MSNPNPHGPSREDNPLASMMVSLSGASGGEHETGPPGADDLSVRAGHEPDRFYVRSILYVPLAVVIVLVLAYLLVTWIFSGIMNNKAVADARAKEQNPQGVEQNAPSWNAKIGQVSSTNPEPRDGQQATGTAQPRREHLYQTLNKAGDGPDPPFYRSKLPDPEGNNPIDVRPEDLRPGNYVSKAFDPVQGEKILASYGWADEGKKLVRVPIDDAIKMVAEGKLKLPVRKDPVKLPTTTNDRASLSNAGRNGTPAAPAPKKDEKHPEKK